MGMHWLAEKRTGHSTFGQSIVGPPQSANFLRVKFEGKKVATSPKKGDEKGGAKIGSDALTLGK
jgi:hypothetical protein